MVNLILKISYRPGAGLATLTRRICYDANNTSIPNPQAQANVQVDDATKSGPPPHSSSKKLGDSIPITAYSTLMSLITTRFGFNSSDENQWALMWIDEEGDHIIVSSDDELSEIISTHDAGQAIRLNLVPADSVALVQTNAENSTAENRVIQNVRPVGLEREASNDSVTTTTQARNDEAEHQNDAASVVAESDTTEVISSGLDKGKAKEIDQDSKLAEEGHLPEDWTFADRFEVEDGEHVPASGTTTPSLLDFVTPLDTSELPSESDSDPLDEALPTSSSAPKSQVDSEAPVADDPPEPTIPVSAAPPLNEALQTFLSALPLHADALKTHFASFLSYPHPQAIPSLFQTAPVAAPYEELLELVRSAREELRRTVEGVRSEAESIRGEFGGFREKLHEDKKQFDDDVKLAMNEAKEASRRERRKAKEMAKMARYRTKEGAAAATATLNEPTQSSDSVPDAKETSQTPTLKQSTSASSTLPAEPQPSTSPSTSPSTLNRDDLFARRVSSTRELSAGFDSTLASIRASQQARASSSSIPGAFPISSNPSPNPTPLPSTSQAPYSSPWAEVTPRQLQNAIKDMGIDAKITKVTNACEKVWEENRGKTLEEMVEKVLARVL